MIPLITSLHYVVESSGWVWGACGWQSILVSSDWVWASTSYLQGRVLSLKWILKYFHSTVFTSIFQPVKRIGVAIGEYVLDLSQVTHFFKGPVLSQNKDVFKEVRM